MAASAIAAGCALAVLVVVKCVLMVPVWWRALSREDRAEQSERLDAALAPTHVQENVDGWVDLGTGLHRFNEHDAGIEAFPS